MAYCTPHLFLLDSERKIAYMGGFDDNFIEEDVKHHYLVDALEALIAGKPPEVTELARKAVRSSTTNSIEGQGMMSTERFNVVVVCAISTAMAVGLCGCPNTAATPPKTSTSAGSMIGIPVPGVPVPSPQAKAGALSVGEKLEADGISLVVASPAGVEAFVKENKGKVVLVDFWATWCALLEVVSSHGRNAS